MGTVTAEGHRPPRATNGGSRSDTQTTTTTNRSGVEGRRELSSLGSRRQLFHVLGGREAKIGDTGVVTTAGAESIIAYRVLSADPRILFFPNLVTPQEAARIISVGEPQLKRSGVVGVQSPQHRVRTSFGARLSDKDDPVVKTLNRRILDAFQREFRGDHAERLYFLRYEVGQYYYGHVDSFGGVDGKVFRALGNKAHPQRSRMRNGSVVAVPSLVANKTAPRRVRPLALERAVTVLVYLSNVTHGGNTSFPMLTPSGAMRSGDGGFRTNRDDPCDPAKVLTVSPRVGSAVAFFSIDEWGRELPASIHSGCRVEAGVKYSLTKWLMVPFYDSDYFAAVQRAAERKRQKLIAAESLLGGHRMK
mgnify:FL=1